MCFKRILPGLAVVAAFCLAVPSCGYVKKIAEMERGTMAAVLSIPSDADYEKTRREFLEEIRIDSLDSDNGEDVFIMNAVREEETGEMVAVDVISASRVVARFRNVAERFGKISLEFDITVPEVMIESGWRLRFQPVMKMLGDSAALEPVYITGEKYRDEQMLGYRRYNDFLASIITDSLDFIRIQQLEIFIRRNYPQMYAMRNDSSFVPDPVARDVFGVSQREALEHYTRHSLIQRNDRKRANSERMFHRYVKDPLIAGSMRLDTVMSGVGGDMVYRYVQEVDAKKGLKRIDMSLSGELYEDGKVICAFPRPDDLTFYVSSLSTLADLTPRYVMRVIERRVYDNTYAFIDFAQGSAVIDTLLPGNLDELHRVRECAIGIVERDEFELDSLKVSASCSPEGVFAGNEKLSRQRAESVKNYLGNYLDRENRKKIIIGFTPENWAYLERLATGDSEVSDECRKLISEAAAEVSAGGWDIGVKLDRIEEEIAQMKEYLYLRQKIYPKLRSVRFDFYLHRRGMLKDTVHTTEIDTVYLAGVQAIMDMDYSKAVEILRPYHDYNSALACISAGYDHSALADLEAIANPDAASDYLKAVVLSRLGRKKESMESYLKSVEKEPSMAFRANLDPELSGLINNLL